MRDCPLLLDPYHHPDPSIYLPLFWALLMRSAPLRSRYLPFVMIAPLVSVWAFMLDGIFIGAVATPEMRNAMLLMLVLTVGVGEVLIPAFGNRYLPAWPRFQTPQTIQAPQLQSAR